MLERLISLTVFFVIAIGLALHFQVDWMSAAWIGHLPGDLILRKSGVVIFLPFTTAFLLSVVLTCVSSVLTSK